MSQYPNDRLRSSGFISNNPNPYSNQMGGLAQPQGVRYSTAQVQPQRVTYGTTQGQNYQGGSYMLPNSSYQPNQDSVGYKVGESQVINQGQISSYNPAGQNVYNQQGMNEYDRSRMDNNNYNQSEMNPNNYNQSDMNMGGSSRWVGEDPYNQQSVADPQSQPIQSYYEPNQKYNLEQDQGYISDDMEDTTEPNGLCRIIMLICPLLFALITLILFSIIIGYQNSTNEIEKRDSIQAMRNFDNLMSAPLLKDFKMMAAGAKCPAGYNDQEIGSFAGVNSECVCKDGTIHSYAYCAFASDCQYQSSVGETKEFIWNTNKICVQKSDMSKIKYLGVGKSCEAGYKQCPYNICSKDDKCPMTKIYYSNDKTTKKRVLNIDNAAEPKGPQWGPVVGFTAVESKDQHDCLVPQYYQPQTESKKNYPAFKIPLKGCGKYGNAAGQVKIESISSTNFENDNKLTPTLKNLQYYNILMDSKTKNSYSLLSVSRPQMKRDQKCEKGGSKNGVSIANHIDGYSDINLGFGITILVLCCIVILIGIVLILQIIKKVPVMVAYQVLAFLIALLVISYMITIWAYSADYNINDHYTRYKALIDHNCLPADYAKPAKDMLTEINMFWDTIYWLGVTAFIIACVFIVVELVAIALRKPEWRCNPTANLDEEY